MAGLAKGLQDLYNVHMHIIKGGLVMRRLCFPVTKDDGLESVVYEHFGSAPMFIVVDGENKKIETLTNMDLHHQHGQCNPMKALGNNKVDVVVVGGIGGGALMGLKAQGIKVFKAQAGTVRENLELFDSGGLTEIALNQTCSAHNGQIHLSVHKHAHECCGQ